MTKPNFGLMTEDETAQLAVDALEELPLHARVQAVLKAFDAEEREELSSWLVPDADAPASTEEKAPVEGTPSASGTDSTG